MTEENKEKSEELCEKFLINEDSNPDDTIELLKKIKNLSKNEAVAILNYLAGKASNPKVLLYLVQMIGKYKDRSSVEVLIEILTDYKKPEEQEKYQKIRCTTAAILGEIRDDRAVVPLMYIMNDKNEYYKIRLSTAEALGKIGNIYAVNPLINIVTDEEEKSVYLRESAAKALGMIGDERAVDPLISIIETKKGLLDKFTFLKEKTVEALGKLVFNQEKKLNTLKFTLLDESPHIRISTMEALCEIDDDIILSLIEPMIYDKDENVARSAVNALYNLQGRDFVLELPERYELPDWCKEEIDEILEEDEEEGEDDE